MISSLRRICLLHSGVCFARKLKEQRAREYLRFLPLTTELAATIGTGNIVGVATAMVLGGPGALF